MRVRTPHKMNAKKISDQEVIEQVINPIGGIERFRLIVCPDCKLIEYFDEEGQLFGLILEDNDLFDVTIAFLERAGVAQVSLSDE